MNILDKVNHFMTYHGRDLERLMPDGMRAEYRGLRAEVAEACKEKPDGVRTKKKAAKKKAKKKVAKKK